MVWITSGAFPIRSRSRLLAEERSRVSAVCAQYCIDQAPARPAHLEQFRWFDQGEARNHALSEGGRMTGRAIGSAEGERPTCDDLGPGRFAAHSTVS